VNLKKKVKNITLNPSARLDYNESYGFQLCPQFDISFENNDFNLRSSLGRTIRSADFTERFYNYNYSDTLSIGRNIGNPDLEAEKSLNFEIGVDIKRYKNLLFKNTVFIRRSTNLIDWVLTNSDEIISNVNTYENSDYLYAQNISNLNTLGYEGEFWFKFLNQENLNLDGSLGYTKIFNSEPGQNIFQNNINISSKYLANSSGDRFSYNIIAKNKKLKLNLNGQLKVREKENDISINQNLGKAYFVQNLNLGYLHNEFISLDFEIINLFNTNYSDLLGAIMPKRWLIVGLEVKI
jgi:iron complex outermembrane receptor protein